MADEELAWVEVCERGLTHDGIRYAEGRVVQVPEHALPSITEVDPPRGRHVSAEYAEAVRMGLPTEDIDPDPGGEPDLYQPEVDATDAARELAEIYDMDLSEIEGTGSEGRVIKPDVVATLEARAG